MATDNRVEVTPEYRHTNVMATSRWLSNDKRKIYPVDIGRHSVRVKYVYEKQYGQQKLVELGYYCEKCDKESFIEDDYLYEADDEAIAKVRGYIFGYFYEHDCV